MMMHALTRRRFLGQMGLTAAAATTATAALTVTQTALTEEDVDLLRLGAELASMVLHFEAAASEKAAARQRYEDIKPAVPDVLIVRYPDPFSRDFAEGERDVEAKFVSYDDGPMRRSREIVRGWALRRGMKDTDGRTARGKRIRKLLPVAEAYEAGLEEAEVASGWRAADGELRTATMNLIKLADQACGIEAATLKGLGIQSQAFLAALATGHDAMFHPTRWGPQLARSVASVAGRA